MFFYNLDLDNFGKLDCRLSFKHNDHSLQFTLVSPSLSLYILYPVRYLVDWVKELQLPYFKIFFWTVSLSSLIL